MDSTNCNPYDLLFVLSSYNEYGKQHTGLERVKEALGTTLMVFLMRPLMFLGYLYKQLRNLTQ